MFLTSLDVSLCLCKVKKTVTPLSWQTVETIYTWLTWFNFSKWQYYIPFRINWWLVIMAIISIQPLLWLEIGFHSSWITGLWWITLTAGGRMRSELGCFTCFTGAWRMMNFKHGLLCSSWFPGYQCHWSAPSWTDTVRRPPL